MMKSTPIRQGKLRRGELLPAVMLDHIAEQVRANAEVIALFARRGATRYE